MTAIVEGRDRLQAALVALSRRSRPRARAAAGRTQPPVERRTTLPAAPLQPAPAASRPEPQAPVSISVDLSGLIERLERIEERISDLQRAPRPRPATGDLFAEWVRLRRWEEIPFADFLKLRRAGAI